MAKKKKLTQSTRGCLVRFRGERTLCVPIPRARNAALASSRLSATPPLGPSVGARLYASRSDGGTAETQVRGPSPPGRAGCPDPNRIDRSTRRHEQAAVAHLKFCRELHRKIGRLRAA
jgi:hypothetical protein